MLSFRMASAHQYDEFLQLMRVYMADYLDALMTQMQMSWEQFEQLYRTIGQIYVVYQQGEAAGYYWIELRGRDLHLHGLILKDAFRGMGIGTEVLKKLAVDFRDQADFIELGVHQSNQRAQALYLRQGFEVVRVLNDLGFDVMQRPLGGAN